MGSHHVEIRAHPGELVGFFELDGEEIEFFGLALPWIGRRIGPWLLDRAIERARSLAGKDRAAYATLKRNLHGPTIAVLEEGRLP